MSVTPPQLWQEYIVIIRFDARMVMRRVVLIMNVSRKEKRRKTNLQRPVWYVLFGVRFRFLLYIHTRLRLLWQEGVFSKLSMLYGSVTRSCWWALHPENHVKYPLSNSVPDQFSNTYSAWKLWFISDCSRLKLTEIFIQGNFFYPKLMNYLRKIIN